MSPSLPLPPVLVITDRRQTRLRLPDLAQALLEGGCRWLSLREKDLQPEERCALLRRLVEEGRSRAATIMVHDDLAAAQASGAAGVHLPAGGSIAEARRVLGPGKLVGRSAHRAADVAAAAADGADYVTLSPIFASASKPGYGPALGVETLRAAPATAWPVPVIALGGIDAANAAACLAAGASGIAVMGEAMRAADPRQFMAGLLRSLPPSLAPTGAPRP